MLFMIYEEHDITVDCKHLARDNVGRRGRWKWWWGEGVSRSSFTTTEREVGVIKLSIAVKGHTLRSLSRKSNSSAKSGPAVHHANKFSG
jgi:hypothetical protein